MPYMDIVNITEEELKEMMDNETWINGARSFRNGICYKIS